MARPWGNGSGWPRRVFDDAPGIRHAILLTDGKNESEEPGALDETLSEVEGSFQCDCRGVGDQWDLAEVRRVAMALMGTVDVVATPDELEADFTGMMRDALRKQVADVALRVWTPQGAELVSLKQIEPPLELTSRPGRRGTPGRRLRDRVVGRRVARLLPERACPARRGRRGDAGGAGDVARRRGAVRAGARAGGLDRRRRQVGQNEQAGRRRDGVTEMADAVQEGVDARGPATTARRPTASARPTRWRVRGGQRGRDRAPRARRRGGPGRRGASAPRNTGEEIDMMILEARSTCTSKTSGPHGFVGDAGRAAPPVARRRTTACTGRAEPDGRGLPQGPRQRVGRLLQRLRCRRGGRGRGEGQRPPGPLPNCGSPLESGSACAECGHLLGAPDTATPWEEQLWEVVVRPDRAFYDQQDQDDMEFPEKLYARGGSRWSATTSGSAGGAPAATSRPRSTFRADSRTPASRTATPSSCASRTGTGPWWTGVRRMAPS